MVTQFSNETQVIYRSSEQTTTRWLLGECSYRDDWLSFCILYREVLGRTASNKLSRMKTCQSTWSLWTETKVATATSYVHHSAAISSTPPTSTSMCILIFLKGKSFANDPMVLIVIYYNTIDRVPEDFWSFETILPPMIPWCWLLFTTIPSIECLKTSGVVHFASCTLPPMISWY